MNVKSRARIGGWVLVNFLLIAFLRLFFRPMKLKISQRHYNVKLFVIFFSARPLDEPCDAGA